MGAPGRRRVAQRLFGDASCPVPPASDSSSVCKDASNSWRVGLDAMFARQIVQGAQSLLHCSQPVWVEFHRRRKRAVSAWASSS